MFYGGVEAAGRELSTSGHQYEQSHRPGWIYDKEEGEADAEGDAEGDQQPVRRLGVMVHGHPHHHAEGRRRRRRG